jgi:hypothetical protein
MVDMKTTVHGTLHSEHIHLVVINFFLAETLQAQPRCWSMIDQYLDIKADHLTSSWVWSSSWVGLRTRLPCTHFQQILNQSHRIFDSVTFHRMTV